MSYTGNHRIDAVLLVAINDGDGSQCGMSYAQRCDKAFWHLGVWREAFDKASQHCGTTVWSLTPREIKVGVEYLRQYYRDHVREMDPPPRAPTGLSVRFPTSRRH